MKERIFNFKNICSVLALSAGMVFSSPVLTEAADGGANLVVQPFERWDTSLGADGENGGTSEENGVSGGSDGTEADGALRDDWLSEGGNASRDGSEAEGEAASEEHLTEAPETELSPSEERNLRLDSFLETMPDDFVFPMVTEEEPELLFGLGRRLRIREQLEGYQGLDVLELILEEEISGYDGDWSVYVKNLNTNEEFVINDRPMKSASVMKLFILGAVYRAFEEGELERSEETMSLVQNMITVSDNEASNALLYLLGNSSYERGIERVNEFIREYGFSDMTTEFNGFENSATVMDSSHFNQVAAKDCGKLLEDIYRRAWVDRDASNEIEEMLLNQHTRYKIPGGLPEGVLCGNKSGEMSTTENDAAIIYSDACDYILVVLSSDWYSKDEAILRISSLSRTVYEYLN